MNLMEQLIAGFPNQLDEAIAISKHIDVDYKQDIHNILILGLGGSGIGGNLVESILRNRLFVPINTSKTYNIPNWVSSNTLLIFCSYSGNTEETLACFEEAKAINCPKYIITSGGKLAEFASTYQIPIILIPGGMPPRACLGYSMTQILQLIHLLKLCKTGAMEELNASVSLLQTEQANIQHLAANIAQQLHGKTPVIYIRDRMEAVAIRWRQQINENSKLLCWHHAIPEMNHNELVGWKDKRDDLAVILIRNADDPERIQLRYDINKTVIQQYCDTIIEVQSKGNSFLERAMYNIHLGDWVSTELAKIRDLDAVEVNVIDFLKGELSKHA